MSQVNTQLVNRARNYCLKSHAGQTRKFAAIPFSTHPFRVAEIIQQHEGTPLLVAAAYLHDVLEQGVNVTYQGLLCEFPQELCELVLRVSNHEACLAQYIGRVKQCPQASRIKLADMLANIEGLHKEPIGFVRRQLLKTIYTYRKIAHHDTPLAAAFLTEWRKQFKAFKARVAEEEQCLLAAS